MEPAAGPPQLPPAFAKRTPYDQQGLVIESVRCCRCGYDVRGLHLQAVCPECREPVARSVVGDLLEFMPAERIRRLHRLLGQVSLGTYLSVLMPLAAIPVVILLGTLALPTLMTQAASTLMMLLGLLVLSRAWWGLASLDAAVGQTDLSRASIRGCVLLTVGYLAWLAQGYFGGFNGLRGLIGAGGLQPGGPGGGFLLAELIGLLLFPVWIGCSAAYFWHAQRAMSLVARKAPDPLLEHRTRSRQLSSVLWWTLGLLAFFLGPLVAISNLVSSIKDCRFHTRRALGMAEARALAASETGTAPDTLPEPLPGGPPYARDRAESALASAAEPKADQPRGTP